MKKDYKSGFVTLIGRPNVGKSTLMNQLIGQKIAITSNKPQTTRNRIQTVLTTDDGQIVFVDTPGIHKAKNKLGEYMVNVAERTLNEVDVVLWLVEPTTFIGAGEQHIISQLKKVTTPVVLVINKIDSVKKEDVLPAIAAYKDVYDFAEIVPVSAEPSVRHRSHPVRRHLLQREPGHDVLGQAPLCLRHEQSLRLAVQEGRPRPDSDRDR